MAGTITHAYFAKDVYNNFNDENKQRFKNYIENIKTYGQGHDVLFFDFSLFNGKKIRKSANKIFHKKKTKAFFINIIRYIKNNNLENNNEIISFLYGYICHYCLDYTMHPYITYKGGYFKTNDKTTYKYNSKHSEIETYIDCYFINKNEKIKSGNFKIHKYLFNYNEPSKVLKNLIDNVFLETYNIKNIGKRYIKDLKTMKLLYRLMRYDKYGIKLKIYKFIDLLLPRKIKKLYPISYFKHLNNDEYYLNLNHKEWNHPRYKDEKYTYSVLDLYSIAKKDAIKIINAVDKVLKNEENISYLDNYFLNLSFSSGKECNDKTKNQFFEY